MTSLARTNHELKPTDLAGLKFTGDAARLIGISRQRLLQIRSEANITCQEIGGYFLWSEDTIRQAREVTKKEKSK